MLTADELKNVWEREDKYYAFTYKENKNLGSRLKKWRELNNVSQQYMAETIADTRDEIGLSHASINSISHTYHNWETKDVFSNGGTFSINNLWILKHIVKCDYEFLFCEIDTPHVNSRQLSKETGLNIASVEKLASYNKVFSSDDISAAYAKNIFSALNKILSDDNFLAYVTYFLSGSVFENEESPLIINRPVAGIPSEDNLLDGDASEIDNNNQIQLYLMTLAIKLYVLRDSTTENNFDSEIIYKKITPPEISEEGDAFGTRLKKWRLYKKYTQKNVIELIINYRKEHDQFNPLEASVLRSYQNWESKTDRTEDVKLSKDDLQMLRSIMGCDYEYLFGEITTLTVLVRNTTSSIGLNKKNIEKLKKYSQPDFWKDSSNPAYANDIIDAVNLIISDNNLLDSLVFFLSDIDFYSNIDDPMYNSHILKPAAGLPYSHIIEGTHQPVIETTEIIAPSDKAYRQDLFDEKELRNVFLPTICTQLLELRKRHLYNNEAIKNNAIKETDDYISSIPISEPTSTSEENPETPPEIPPEDLIPFK